MNGKVKAWYFSNSDEQLGHNDGRKIELGITHEVNEEIVLCWRGLHASRNLLDALKYAPGFVLWEVECSGQIVEGRYKLAASRRTYLRRLDCQKIIYNFTKACALSVLHLWKPPPIVCDFLKGDDLSAMRARKAAKAAVFAASTANAAACAANAANAATYAAANAEAYAVASAAANSANAAYAVAKIADATAHVTQESFLAEANDVLTEYVLEEMERQDAN